MTGEEEELTVLDLHATDAALERLRALAASLQAKTAPSDNDRIMLEAVLETLAEHEQPPAAG